MDFFHHQDAARAASRRLLVLMAVAIGITVILVNQLASGVGWWFRTFREVREPAHLHAIATIGTLLIIGLGMWLKQRELIGGGPALAVQLGGREILPTTANADERRLRNVVEEMAIAAGIPVPAIFLLDSLGINAFAAGHTLRDSAVAVTKGCLVHLDRDELQAIVAHETSHLLNGDARLNMRMISAVHGLVSISHAGQMLVGTWGDDDSGSESPWFFSYREAALIVPGFALIAIGGIGWLLGEMVRAGVSRQREYLADAAAVQFTRNDAAIANALKKAMCADIGTRVSHPYTAMASHLFFADATSGLSSWMSSHPPLEKRIQRVDPDWDGVLPLLSSTRRLSPSPLVPTPLLPLPLSPSPASIPQAQVRPPSVPAIRPMQVDFAAELLSRLPDALTVAAGEAYSGRAAVLVTLLASDSRAQLAQIRAVDAILAALVLRLQPAWQGLDPVSARLPLLQLALPNLRRLTLQQRSVWLQLVRDTVRLGEPTTRLIADLVHGFFVDQRPPADFHSFQPLLADLTTALGVIAHASSEPAAAFVAGWARLQIAGATPSLPTSGDLDTLCVALTRLTRANAAIRRRIVDAVAHTIAADGRVSPQEAELLRLSCTSLGTPLPLFRDFMLT